MGPPVVVASALVLVLAFTTNSSNAGAAGAGSPPTSGDGFEPVLGLPVTGVVVLGSSPSEERGEFWAYGHAGEAPANDDGVSHSDQLVLLEHTDAAGWQVMGLPSASGGVPLESGIEFSRPPYALGALGGRVTSAGGVVLLTPGGIVSRDPGAQPQLVPAPPPALLVGEESLPPASSPSGAPTPFAATEEAPERVGLMIAPQGDGRGSAGGPAILRYSGSGVQSGWTREPIAGSASKDPVFTPEALACGGRQPEPSGSSPQNCWLLAAYNEESSGTEPNRLALFRRIAKSGNEAEYVWEQQRIDDQLLGSPSAGSGAPTVEALGTGAQMLTVTSQGAWVDFKAKPASGGAATDVSELVAQPASPGAEASVLGTWCFGAETSLPGCEAQRTIETALPSQYTSFAWPGSSSSDPGERVITGLDGNAMLELSGAGGFSYVLGPGGQASGGSGAAFVFSPQGTVERGMIGLGEDNTGDYQGQSQVANVTPQPQDDQLQGSPVPFRHALLAIAQAPGTTAGDPNAPAIAVGLEGEIGRYTPGQGWSSEGLYESGGEVVKVTLRGVAWPEPGRAYAVGDGGAMWLWQADTGLWEPDPATPYNFVGNLTAIAFSPSDSSIGYAVGKQGVLLSYGKTWEEPSPEERSKLEQELKLELDRLNFTSVAFAGSEAIVTYRAQGADGGLLVNDGSGWHVDSNAASLLAQLPAESTALSRVAGLPDGGAVAAGPGLVIERDEAKSPWRFSPQPLPEARNVSALAAYRDASGSVDAVISIDLDPYMNPYASEGAFSDEQLLPSGPGQPPLHLPPDPVPDTGYVLRETASGWSDIEHMALPASPSGDMPVRPDPVLALLVSPDGTTGVGVGGQTDDTAGSHPSPDSFETAAAMRFGAGAATAGVDTPAAISTATGVATFAVGGGAACEQACANFADEGLAPDVLLAHALQTSAAIAASSPGGLRGFLYTGDRLPSHSSSLGSEAFERELERYTALLGSASPLPVRAAASPNDVAPSGGIESFVAALEPFGPSGGKAYYTFLSEGATGGKVRVIVLDYSAEALDQVQQAWLVEQLQIARREGQRAIVMGNASLGFSLPEEIGFNPPPVQAHDAMTVSEILVKGGASAYLFDYPGVNVATQVSYGGKSIPAFGTGTLGYASPPGTNRADSLGSSGFLLLEVPASTAVPVSARVEPNIGELALQPTDGTLLRRSHAAYFEALARVPPSGRAIQSTSTGAPIVLGPAPYEPIPFNCLGADCADRIATEYTFASSNPDVGDFVAHEPGSDEVHQVLLGANGKPITDPQSGLFCAYNAGTTTVSITTGGLTYSEPVTVQGGSAEYPCGTVPLKNPPPRTAPSEHAFSLPNLTPNTTPGNPSSPLLTLPVPALVAARAHHPHHHHPARVPAALAVPVVGGLVQLPPAIVPPAPTAARPSPPSGTSSAQVYQNAVAPESEREEEGAVDMVHNFARYSSGASRLAPRYLPLLILLFAFMGSRIFIAWRQDPPEAEAIAVQRQD
jgi:hypothetical protein